MLLTFLLANFNLTPCSRCHFIVILYRMQKVKLYGVNREAEAWHIATAVRKMWRTCCSSSSSSCSCSSSYMFS